MQLRPVMSHLNSGGSHTRLPLQQVERNVGTGGPAVPSVKVRLLLFCCLFTKSLMNIKIPSLATISTNNYQDDQG
jgi:hypothetical protein